MDQPYAQPGGTPKGPFLKEHPFCRISRGRGKPHQSPPPHRARPSAGSSFSSAYLLSLLILELCYHTPRNSRSSSHSYAKT